jgi:hypothetical protein
MSDYATKRMLREVNVSPAARGFASAMLDAAGWSAPDVLDFLDKPWKWSDEFAMWLDLGKPGAGDARFGAFAALVGGSGLHSVKS